MGIKWAFKGLLLAAISVPLMAAAPVTLDSAAFAAWVASLSATNTAATTPAVTTAPILGVTADGSAMLLNTRPWFSDQGILSTYDLGKTIAALDSSGNVTSGINSAEALVSPDAFGDYLAPSFPGGLDPQRGYEADLIGGWSKRADGSYVPRQMLIQADPYGPYSAGCGVAVNVGSGYTAQSPVSEAAPSAGASSVVAVGAFDTVASCALYGNTAARLVLPVSSYTATSVILSSALTAAQVAQIHPNMYITTNTINSALASGTSSNTGLVYNLAYAGFVSKTPSAGDTSISVYSWDVPGNGTGVSGQVPSTSSLDTGAYSNYGLPVVFLGGGAAHSAFAHNWFAQIDASRFGDKATSMIHQITPLEIDLNIVNGTLPSGSLFYSGISMNAGNQPAALTSKSRDLFLGGDINHHVIINGGCGNWDIESTTSGGYTYLPTPCTLSNGGTYTSQLLQGWTRWIHGTNKLTMALYDAIGNTSAAAGWQEAVVHLGPTVDATPAQTGDIGGSKQGDIEWNAGANYGSISLCGYATACGLRVNGDGTVKVTDAATFLDLLNTVKGLYGISAAGANEVQLYPTSAGDWTVGTSVSGGGSIRGVNGYYGSTMTLTGSATVAGIILPDSTAPVSTASCTAGATRFVGAYMYHCIASGNWGRIALTTGY